MKTKVLEIMDLKLTVYNQIFISYSYLINSWLGNSVISLLRRQIISIIRAVIDAQKSEHEEPEPYNQNISSTRGPE